MSYTSTAFVMLIQLAVVLVSTMAIYDVLAKTS